MAMILRDRHEVKLILSVKNTNLTFCELPYVATSQNFINASYYKHYQEIWVTKLHDHSIR